MLVQKKVWKLIEGTSYFLSFIVMESAEEIPLSKLSLFKIEKILSKSFKTKNS